MNDQPNKMDDAFKIIRRQIERQVANLNPDVEDEALRWIEAVSEFDEEIPNPQLASPGLDPGVHE
jgi:hypothetical protein